MKNLFVIEQLEARKLLAHVGLDLEFGELGAAPVGGSSLLMDVSGGKILAVGQTSAARLNADGSIDTSFNDAGADEANRPAGRAFLVGERILLAGKFLQDQQFFVRAIHADDGSVDTSFGDNGIFIFTPTPVTPGLTFNFYYSPDIIATADGGIIVGITQYQHAGNNHPITYGDVLYKISAAGELDSTFGDGGVVVINESEEFEAEPRLAALPDGKSLLVRSTSPAWNAVLERRNSDGSLDTTFAANGVATLPGSGFPFRYAPVIQTDGKILIPWNDSQDFGTDGYVSRLNADGAIDTTFGNNGTVALGAGSGRPFVIIAPDGKVVGNTSDGRIFRLTSTGQFDTTFDDDGFISVRKANLDGTIDADAQGNLDVDAAGGLLLGGTSTVRRFIERQRVVLAPNGVVHITGTDGADTISVGFGIIIPSAPRNVLVNFNEELFEFAESSVTGINLDGGEGDLNLEIRFVNVATTILSGAGNDSISTADARDWVIAGDGDDIVNGGGGNDIIFGGYGNDTLIGGAGSDKLLGEADADSIDGGDGNDTLFGGSPFRPLPEELQYRDRADTIFGGDGRDRIFGNEDSDRLHGNAGPDIIHGGVGADRTRGNGGRDVIFAGGGADHLYGGAARDRVYGQGGDDLIFGGGANDFLHGGLGADTLFGGAGNDSFVTIDGIVDELFGGEKRDTALADQADLLREIEVRT